MRRHSRTNNALKLAGLSIALTTAMGGLGYATWKSIGKETADEYGCFAAVPQRQTVVLVDVSEPRFNEEQSRSLQRYFDQLYTALEFNERLSIITTAEDQIGSIPRPRVHVCGQAENAAQLEAVNADGASAGFLAKQKERLYQKKYAPAVNAFLSPNADQSEQQLYQSPVLEMIQSIRRFQPLRPGDRLIVISDLIQNSDSLQFCRTQNDMPSFSVFATRPIYARLKPETLKGIEVEVLMIQRTGYGQSGYTFCRSEEELRRFWLDYLTANGVANPSFIRIRHGIVGG